jgi:phosphoribosyl-ATP pyrophosphohydrolase/phosphoribosyl-AMP cyclohydrolase
VSSWRDESLRSHVLNLTLLRETEIKSHSDFRAQSADPTVCEVCHLCQPQVLYDEWPDASIQGGHHYPVRTRESFSLMADTIIQNVKFDERGLIPAILQDAATSEIVALCYMDSASLANTLKTGQTDFLTDIDGQTGKRAAHRLLDVRVNTDGGSLTVLIERDDGPPPQKRPVSLLRGVEDSHRPRSTEVSLVDVGSMEFGLGLNKLYGLIAERKEKRPEGSYTTYLFNSGLDKILKNASQREIVSELADLLYHLIVLMVERDVRFTEINEELTRRASQSPETRNRSDRE